MKRQKRERYRWIGAIGLLTIGILCGSKGIVAQAQENILYENGYYYQILDNGKPSMIQQMIRLKFS